MIKNINTIQNIDDEAVNRYIVHALANMGQRGMFENHGFSYKTMSFFDLLNESTINLDLLEEIKEHPENWCGAITEDIEGCLKYYIISKSEAFDANPDPGQQSTIKTLYEDINFNNCVTLDNDVLIDTPIADIVALRKDTLIYNANDYIIVHGKGLINGNNPNVVNLNSGKDATFFYAKYDAQDQNKLLEYYRTGLISVKDWESEIYYACSLIKNEDTSETTTYTLKVYVKTIAKTLVMRHKLMFNDDEAKSIVGSIDDIKNINININIDDINAANTPTIVKVFNLIKNECDNSYEFENISISTVGEISNDLNISLGANDFDIAKLISDANATRSLLLYDLLSYHNSIYYTASKACLTKRLLGDLYFDCKNYADTTYRNYGEDVESVIEYKAPILYVPFDLDLHYVCDAADELKVYYTNTIYVLMCNMLNLAHDIIDLSNNLIFDYNIFEDSYEINSYDMQVYYNTEYNDIISDMSLKHIYSMPSIRDGEWYINGVETGISARGFDAGNPNMLVLKFNTDDMTDDSEETPHPEILNTISSKYYEFKNKIDYIKKTVAIEYQGASYTCEISIPVINDDNAELIRDTLLLYYITHNIAGDGEDPQYINVLTFWYPTTGEYQPVYLPGGDHAFYVMSTNEEENDIVNLDKHYERLENLWNDTVSYLHGDVENVDKLDYAYVGEVRIPIGVANNATGHEISGDIDYVKITNNTMDKYISLDPSNRYINNTNIVITPHSTNDIGNNDNYKIDTSNTYAVPILSTYEYELSGIYNNSAYVNVPSMSFENMILKNTTFTNRINVLCVDKGTDNKSIIYNAYIGTSKNDLSKSTIHIGTSTSNINLKTKNTNNNDPNTFNESTQLSIDLPTTIINSSVISEDSIPVNKVQKAPTFDHDTDIYNVTIPICGYLDKSNYAVLYEANVDVDITQSAAYNIYKDNALYYIGDGSELMSGDNFIFKMCDIYVNYTVSGARLTRHSMISYDEYKGECLLLFNPYKLLVNQIKFIDFDTANINMIFNDNGGRIKAFSTASNDYKTIFVAMSVSKNFINNFTNINSGTDNMSVIQCIKEYSNIQKPFIITGDLLNVTIRDKGSNSYDIIVSPQKDFYVNNTLATKKYGIKRLSL